MTYLSKRLKVGEWKKSFVLSFLSTSIIGLTYLVSPREPNYAGAMFSYNLSFFLPMLFLSTILGIAAIVYLIRFSRYLKEYEVKYRKQRILATILFLIPFLFHFITALIFFITIHLEVRQITKIYCA